MTTPYSSSPRNKIAYWWSEMQKSKPCLRCGFVRCILTLVFMAQFAVSNGINHALPLRLIEKAEFIPRAFVLAKALLRPRASLCVVHARLLFVLFNCVAARCKTPCQSTSLFRASCTQRHTKGPTCDVWSSVGFWFCVGQGANGSNRSHVWTVRDTHAASFCVTPVCHTALMLAI